MNVNLIAWITIWKLSPLFRILKLGIRFDRTVWLIEQQHCCKGECVYKEDTPSSAKLIRKKIYLYVYATMWWYTLATEVISYSTVQQLTVAIVVRRCGKIIGFFFVSIKIVSAHECLSKVQWRIIPEKCSQPQSLPLWSLSWWDGWLLWLYQVAAL